MHDAIRERLEEVLAAGRTGEGFGGVGGHLAGCSDCAAEVNRMGGQAALLREWRTPEEVEPQAGFYARVMQRIEERAKDSIWAVFIYSPFGKRLALASLTVALLMGSYVVAQEGRDGHLTGESVIAQDVHYDALVVGSEAEQRDAVLANFAQHHPANGQGNLQ